VLSHHSIMVLPTGTSRSFRLTAFWIWITLPSPGRRETLETKSLLRWRIRCMVMLGVPERLEESICCEPGNDSYASEAHGSVRGIAVLK
jgi:hypothetical protein